VLQALLEPQGLSPELLSEVLQWRLTKPDCDRGVILDGLQCRFVATGARRGAGTGGGGGGRDGEGGAAIGKVQAGKDAGKDAVGFALSPTEAEGEGTAGDEAAAALVVAKAACSAMPTARLLVLRFKDGEDE